MESWKLDCAWLPEKNVYSQPCSAAASSPRQEGMSVASPSVAAAAAAAAAAAGTRLIPC